MKELLPLMYLKKPALILLLGVPLYNYQDVKADQKLLFTITLIPIGEIPLGSKSQSKQR